MGQLGPVAFLFCRLVLKKLKIGVKQVCSCADHSSYFARVGSFESVSFVKVEREQKKVSS